MSSKCAIFPGTWQVHTVSHANRYCIMLALADSLAATSIESNACHQQPDFRNQSDIGLYMADGTCPSLGRDVFRFAKSVPVRSFSIGQITSDGAL